MVVDRLRAADLLDAAVIEHDDPVGHLERLLLIVRDEDRRDVQIVVQPAQPAAQLLAHLRVERAERLVEQQHLRLDGERARERDPLPLPARQLGRIALREPVELHEREQLVHLLADRRLARPLAARLHAQPERDVLEHRHVAEQRIVLEHEADLPLARADRRDVEPLQHDLPRIRVLEARDHA